MITRPRFVRFFVLTVDVNRGQLRQVVNARNDLPAETPGDDQHEFLVRRLRHVPFAVRERGERVQRGDQSSKFLLSDAIVLRVLDALIQPETDEGLTLASAH